MTTSERPTSDAPERIWICHAPAGVVSSGPEVTSDRYVDLWRDRGWNCEAWYRAWNCEVWYRASAPASPAIGIQAVKALEALINDVQEWVDAVGRGTSWDYWDHHYKHLAYGGLDKYRAALESALHPAPEAASAGGAGIDEATMGRRWRVFEAIQHGWWGIEIDGDEEPLLYPIKTARETLSRLVDIHNTALSTPSDTAPSPKGVSDGVRDVLAERRRQIEAEGWDKGHDDEHEDGSLAQAAACYAHPSPRMGTYQTQGYDGAYYDHPLPKDWPRSWSGEYWKPKERRRDLVRAGALILAEIERLDRAALSSKSVPATSEERSASKEGA